MDDNNLEDEVSKFLDGFKMVYTQIKSLLERILRDVPNNKDLLISFGRETVWVSIEGKSSMELITLRPSRHWTNSYVIDKNSKMAIWFLETNVDPEAIKDYGFKSMNKYESWKTNIISKYDLNPSKDKYLYTK